ncbi:iron chelate uptake ABC transporter family permease subunit, partial [uncultured Desulfovibrio sp.]|uniref:iron chelate uptake ABC transporter family permease subunit n=1 Tax=uncultured Desulfovibrio sp. TaxID=167968 RepID=UPI00263B9C6D
AAFLGGLAVGMVQILGGVFFTGMSGLGTLGATYGNTDFGTTMMLLTAVMKVIGNVWFFVALLAAVYAAGMIGFVGLVVPHILRLSMGAAHGPLLAGAFLGGGTLLLWADVAARCVLDGGRELPVGVVTALLGGPFFALLVRRR